MANDKKLEFDTEPIVAEGSVGDKKSKNDEKPASKLNFLSLVSTVVLIYLSLKFIAVPIIQTSVNFANKDKISTEIIKVPDFTFPDITLLAIILFFRPETAEMFKSINVSSGGISADFRELKTEFDKTKADLDKKQQEQIDAMNKLQKFMYRLLLSATEIEKLRGIKNGTMTSFNVSNDAAAELRRLRDSDLIRIKSSAKYISDLQRASNNGDVAIDLTKYCELTETGEEYLQNLETIISENHQ